VSSVRFTLDSLSSGTLPTLTAAFHMGWWAQIRSGGYNPSGDTAIIAFGTTGGSSQGFQLAVAGGSTDLWTFTFANGGSNFDPHVIASSSNTAWRAFVLQYSGTGTAYTLRYRAENVTTWTSVTLDCGVAITAAGGSLYIGNDQFGEECVDGNVKGFWCQAATITDANALTASQNARQSIAPSGTNLHWLDLDSATNVNVNGGTAGNWTIGGSPATDASEPVESGGGTTYNADAGTDTIAITDGVTIAINHLTSVTLSTDTIAITDDAQWDRYFATDTISTSDSTARSVEFGRLPADTAAVSDSFVRNLEYGRAPTDSVSSTDSTNLASEFGRSASDSITGSDAVATEAQYLRSPNDSMTVTDSITAQVVTPGILDVQVSDSITASDSLALEGQFGRLPSDSITSSDQTILGVEFGRFGSDSITTTDLGVRSVEFARQPSDSITLLDDTQIQLTSPSTLDVQLNDSITTSDNLGTASDQVRAAADSLVSNDQIILGVEFGRLASDSISLLDSLALERSILRVANDTVSMLDDLTIDLIAPAVINVTASDSASTVDVLTTETAYVRGFVDAVLAVDSISIELIKPGNPPVAPPRRGPVRDFRDSTRLGPIKRFIGSLGEAA